MYNLVVMETFGQWLKRCRKENRLTQEQLSQKSKVSASYISTLERSQPHSITGANLRPEPDKVEMLANALGQDVSDALSLAGYAAKNAPAFPDGLQPHDFDGLDSEDIKEIINFIGYIRYKKSQETFNEIAHGKSAPLKDGDILNVDNGNILRKIS